jgi:hypothetical protein
MSQGFQCFYDAFGDIVVTDGVVVQPSSGAIFLVGTGQARGPIREGSENFWTPFGAAPGGTFVGGSGRNLLAAGLAALESGPEPPVGFYLPREPDTWRHDSGFYITRTGASAATIHDGTAVVAELTTGGTAPVGDYVATTYGEDTYNDSDPFTITVTAEDVGGGDLPTFFLNPTDGNAPDGDITVIDAANYELDADTDWTITVDPEGSAQLRYLGDVVAERADGSAFDPMGTYEAVEAEWDRNIQPDENDDPQPTAWSAIVQVRGRTPRSGFAYVIVTEDAGVVTAVDGPYFGALPTPPSGSTVVILAQSDGAGGLEQYHTGALIWP